MSFIEPESLPTREVVPGFHGRFIHTDHLTIVLWDIDEGAIMPEHSHPHEQVMMLLEGTLELNIAGDTRELDTGAVITIQPHMSHSGRAVTRCRAMDVFYPARDDYR
jgi:quercetin dioxygenase-like cupin family protein